MEIRTGPGENFSAGDCSADKDQRTEIWRSGSERNWPNNGTNVLYSFVGCSCLAEKRELGLSMRVADCPKCGAPARPAGSTAYCPFCDWNRLAAVEAVRQGLLTLPIVLLAFFAFSLLTKRWIGVLVISGLALVANAFSAVKLVQQKRELHRTRVSGLNVLSATSTLDTTAPDKGYVIPSRFSHFPSLGVPRKLKMKRIFLWLAVLLSIIALAFTDDAYSLLIPPHTAQDDPQVGTKLGLFTVGVYMGIIWAWWREMRRKRLLRSGQVTFGQVLESDAGMRALLPGITYKFCTENGSEIEGFDRDWTDSYHKEMLVPVFYDSAQPENHVAMCASFYDVI